MIIWREAIPELKDRIAEDRKRTYNSIKRLVIGVSVPIIIVITVLAFIEWSGEGEGSILFVCGYVIFALTFFILLYLQKEREIYMTTPETPYLICQGICLNKRTKKVRTGGRNGGYNEYYVLIQMPDGSRQDVKVMEKIFDKAIPGTKVLAVHHTDESMRDKVNDIFFLTE